MGGGERNTHHLGDALGVPLGAPGHEDGAVVAGGAAKRGLLHTLIGPVVLRRDQTGPSTTHACIILYW